MNKDKVSKCCGAELYDQSETGYAPNEVCNSCGERSESIEQNESADKQLERE